MPEIKVTSELNQNKAEVIATAILSNFVNIPTAVIRQAIKFIILPKLNIELTIMRIITLKLCPKRMLKIGLIIYGQKARYINEIAAMIDGILIFLVVAIT